MAGLLDQSFPSPNGGLLDFSDPSVWALIRQRLLAGDKAVTGDTLDLGAHPALLGQMGISPNEAPAPAGGAPQGNPVNGGGNVMTPPVAPPAAPPPPTSGFQGWGANSNIWPMLMSLGAGIAGGGGWGEGLGRGLAGAAGASQQSRQDEMRQKAYDLQLAELKNTMNYQDRSLGISQQNADTSEASRREASDARAQTEKRQQGKIGGYVSVINAELPNFSKTSQDIIDSRWAGGGGAGDALRRLVTAAAGINGDSPKEIMDLYVPSVTDSEGTRRNKLEALSSYLNGLPGTIGEGYPSLAGKLWKEDAFTVGTQKVTPAGEVGAPVQAGTAAKEGWQSNPAARQKDTLYTLPNGQKAYWRVFPNGIQGWEPAE